MAYSIIAHTVAGSDSDHATTPAINTTGADEIIIALAFYGSVVPTLTDNKGNTWIPRPTYITSGGGPFNIKLYYCQSPTVGSGHTFSTAGASTYNSLAVVAVSGSVASPFDVENSNAGATVSSLQPGSITPGLNNELVVTAICVSSEATTIDSGFTLHDHVPNTASQYVGVSLATLIQTSAAAVNPSWGIPSGATDCVATIASFKAAAAVGNEARETQVSQSIIGGSPDARITQVTQELVGGAPDANVSQVTTLVIQQHFTDELTCLIVVQ